LIAVAVLVDTSVWIDHFRRGHGRLEALLEEGLVICHPFVVGELACGTLRNRTEVLHLMESLVTVESVTNSEALRFIESKHLMGRGIGYVDVHLLAASQLAGVLLWTKDRRLRSVAEDLGLMF
jgi:predicted nucleic acid-binding protein